MSPGRSSAIASLARFIYSHLESGPGRRAFRARQGRRATVGRILAWNNRMIAGLSNGAMPADRLSHCFFRGTSMKCKTPSGDQTGSANRTASGERTLRRRSDPDRLVLIVEADATLAAMISELLDQASIKSEVVATIKTIVARCRPSRVRCLIIDVDTVSLEWNDGSLDQLNTWLRVSPRSIPLLLASVHGPSDGPHAPNVHLPFAAPVRWIRKPFCNRDFLTCLRAMLRETDPLPPASCDRP